MTYPIPIFRVSQDSASDILKQRTMWTGPEFAEALRYTNKSAARKLSTLKAMGVACRIGTSGPSTRWCHVDNLAEAERAMQELRLAWAENKKERNRIKAQRMLAVRAAQRKASRAAKRQAKPPKQPKPVKAKVPVQPLAPAFTIPPRGVPCSVWALGDMA